MNETHVRDLKKGIFKGRLSSYVRQSLGDILLWGFAMVVLMTSRVALLICFWSALKTIPTLEIWGLFMGRSLWFDAQVAAYCVMPLVVLSVLWAIFRLKDEALERIRRIYAYGLTLLLIGFCVSNLGFFQEYHESFNAWVIEVFYDDWKAIFLTACEAYPVGWGLLGAIVSAAIVMAGYNGCLKRLIKSQKRMGAFATPVLCVFALCVLFFWGVTLRGSLRSRPLKQRDAICLADPFLVKLVGNPFNTLYWAYKDAHELGLFAAKGKKLAPEALEQMAQLLWGRSWEGQATFLEGARHAAQGAKVVVQPKHVFLIVMESQNNWPMIAPYDALAVTPNLKALGEQGWWLKNFLPAGFLTIHALSEMITGVPEASLRVNYQKNSQWPYPMSLPATMKRMGYEKARFFNPGDTHWHRLGQFGQDQGFDEIHGAAHVGYDPRKDGSWWGMHDEELFNYVLSQVNPAETSFSLIMTASNHVPFPFSEGELEAMGCPLKEMPKSLVALDDGTVSVRVHAHNWYADRCVGNFIREAEKKFGPALFIITGDHWSRQFLNQQPGLYERSSVPFILYGPDVLKGVVFPEGAAGDHLDVMPTVVELIAPQGFEYTTVGKDLLSATVHAKTGYGAAAIITPNVIVDDKTGEAVKLPWASKDAVLSDVGSLRARYKALRDFAAWMAFEWKSDQSEAVGLK